MELMKNKYGMGRVYLDKRSQFYFSDFCVNGKRFTKSTKIKEHDPANKPLESRAWRIHTEWWTLAHQGMMGSPKTDRVKMKELFDDLETRYIAEENRSLATLRHGLKPVRKFFDHIRAIHVDAPLCNQYNLARSKKVSRASVRREMSHVKTALNLGFENGKVFKVPHIPLPKKPAPREGFYEWNEALLLSAHLPEHLTRLPLLYFLTGWRKNELLCQEIARVDFEKCFMWIPGEATKNGKAKVYPFTHGSLEYQLLCEQIEYTKRIQREKGIIISRLFHRDGKPIKSFDASWESAHKAAGIALRTVHDMRRSAKRSLEMSGAGEHYSMKVMGHESVAVSRSYAVADIEALRATTAKRNEYLEKLRGKVSERK